MGALPTPPFPLFCADRAIIYAALSSLLLKVTPSGTVDEIRILDYSPSGNALAERFANSLARCWRSAVYDTQALKSSEFPAYTRVNVTYKAARDQNGKLKN